MSRAFFYLARAAFLTLVFAARAELPSTREAMEAFQKPSRHFSTGPLWVWNDMLTDRQIVDTLRDLARQDVKQVWVHPRPGLMTPYLSTEWFRLWKLALREAERLDMNVWIYDENSYPSGFAGGFVPELMPESRGKGLKLAPASKLEMAGDIVAVYDVKEGHRNVTAALKSAGSLPEGSYMVAREALAGNSPWHGDRCYVNLLSPGVTEKFIEVTMEPYKREIGKQFGKRVPGVFTDEPNIRPVHDAFPWSEILTAEFQRRWGYDLLDHLPSLQAETGDWRKVRHNYMQVLHEQFVERWARPNFEYCKRNNLEWTGHYWDHEWPNCLGVPDNMSMYAWHQRPAIDCLMNQYSEGNHAQFGNVRMVREMSSVANQLGLKRTLCEIYGAGGWDLRFEDMKRIGDWLQVLGVNTLNEHLSYVTLRGARKRDHPQSFSYHTPWWDGYHQMARYFTRLSAALSQGEQVNRIAVLEPTTTVWMYQGHGKRLKEVGDAFYALLDKLEAAQIEYDILSEDVLANYGKPGAEKIRMSDGKERSRTIVVGKREYGVIIIPPGTENLNCTTFALLGKTLGHRFYGAMPPRVDGKEIGSEGGKFEKIWAERKDAMDKIMASHITDLRCGQKSEGFVIDRSASDKGKLFHMRRQLKDGELLFLVNSSIENPSGGVILSRRKGAQQWDMSTGGTRPFPCVSHAGGISISFELPPSGSLLLRLGDEPSEAEFPAEIPAVIVPSGAIETERVEPNVLTLDFVDVTAGGESRTNVYYYDAGQFVWKKNGLERNPWDSAVQFKDGLISKKFPAGSGFEATYQFYIKDKAPANLQIVIERPDLYQITCNGRPVKARRGEWWLDKAFGRIDLSSAVLSGVNQVTIKASPFTMFHELEPAYLLGDFSLEPLDKGFAVAPTRPIEIGEKGWDAQGCAFYSAGVAYRQKFDVGEIKGRHVVALGKWRGSVARVRVNGKEAGWIGAPPFECDVTSAMKRGVNEVEVTVIGTLKNTLGPHHGNPGLGAAWPSAFHKGAPGLPAGAAYSTVAYGLFEPMVLKRLTPQATQTAAK